MLNIENGDTVAPELFAIEVVKVKNTLNNEIGYSSQLIIVMEKTPFKFFYIPTDVWENTSYEACRKTLQASLKLFGTVSAKIPVFDTTTGKLLDTIDVNDTFPSWKEIDLDATAAPEGVLLH